MAGLDKKISQLDPFVDPIAPGDLFVGVDISDGSGVTKNFTKLQLMSQPGPIGGTTASTGEFTTLQLPTGATINEFSTDGTLAGDSDLALPTEKAVKTYVDAQIATTDEHNELLGLQGGDSTAEYYHLDSQTYNQISSTLTQIILSGGLQLSAGTGVNEFSIDGTLVGDSDTAIPTEKAVKTYVDAQIGSHDEHNEMLGIQGGDSTSEQYYHLTLAQHDGLTDGGVTTLHTHTTGSFLHNELGGLQGGDSTADEFYHLTQSIHDGLFSASPTIGLGDPNGTRLEVDYGADLVSINVGTVQIFDADDEEIIFGITSGIRLRIDYADDEVFKFYDNTGTERLRVSEDGIRLNSGTSFVNEFSIDGTLAGNSDTAIPTEKAVKTYVDNVQALDTINGSWEVVNEDSTASVIFDTPQVDTLYSVVGNLVNEVDGVPSIYAHIITEKSTAGFVVLFSGPMDSANYEFDWILSRMGLASSSSSSSSRSSSSSSSSSSSALPLLAINDGDDILEINDGGDGLLLS